jgi:hypothetical protein
MKRDSSVWGEKKGWLKKGKNSSPEPGKEFSCRLAGFLGGTAMNSPGVLQQRQLRFFLVGKISQLAGIPGIRPRCFSAARFAPGAEHLFVNDIKDVRTGPGHN